MTDDEFDADGVASGRRRPAPNHTDSGDLDNPTEADGEERPPRTVRWIGRIGVYIAVVGTVSAMLGLAAAALGVQPFGNVLMTLALFGVSIAMLFGLAFQAYVGDWSMPG